MEELQGLHEVREVIVRSSWDHHEIMEELQGLHEVRSSNGRQFGFQLESQVS